MNEQWEVRLENDHPEYAEILERAVELTQSQSAQNTFTVQNLLEIENVEQLMAEVVALREETVIVMQQAKTLDQINSEALAAHLANIHQNFKIVISLGRKLDKLNQGLKNYSSVFRGSISQLVTRLDQCLVDTERPSST